MGNKSSETLSVQPDASSVLFTLSVIFSDCCLFSLITDERSPWPECCITRQRNRDDICNKKLQQNCLIVCR